MLSIKFLRVSLWHMSICTGLVIAVAFHEIDGIPDTKTCTKSNHECLKYAYC